MRTLKIFRHAARTHWGGALLAGLLFAGGCSQDDAPIEGGDNVAVSFTAGIDGAAIPSAKSAGIRSATRSITGVTEAGVAYADYIDADGFQTRAFYPGRTGAQQATSNNGLKTRTTAGGDQWETGDGVGIFMLTAGGTFPGGISSGADNVKYNATPGNPASVATFAPANTSQTIYYPQSGTVDFVAYYPYGDKGNGNGEVSSTYIYKVSVANQSAPTAIDVLYAKKEGVSKSKTVPVDLQFAHALSKITLNVTNGEGITAGDISGLTADKVVFKGMPIEASIALQDGTVTAGSDLSQTFNPLKAGTPTATYQATFTAILVPQAGAGGRTVTFTVGTTPYTWTIPNGNTFAAGNHYTYEVTVKKSGIEVGAPSIADWNQNDGPGTQPGTAMEFVKIPAGTFMMGSPANEPDRHPDETQHSVTLTKDFYMSKYQVTHAQYAAFLNSITIGSDGKGDVSYDKDGSSVVEENQTFIYEHALGVKYESGKWVAQAGYENHPVIGVTWYGAKAYADWVGGSLPTEAQWEYACRGDKGTAPFGVGTDGYKLDYTLGNFNWNYSWSWDGSSATANIGTTGTDYPGTTQRVGSYAANSYGLYDMHGNVWEWCSDWYDNDYSTPPSDDPTGPDTGYDRVFRGGGWGSLAQYCRSAIRNDNYPNYAGIDLGFRVAVVP